MAVTFWPDPQVIHDPGPIDSAHASHLLQTLACLHPTGTFFLRDRRGQPLTEGRFEAPEGLARLIRLLESPFSPPVHPTIVRGSLRTAAGEATVALRWCRDIEDSVTLFANDRLMPHGGTPVVGLRTGVPHAIRRFARALPAGTVVPTGRAYRSGLVACVAVRVEEPMFVGATHGQLGNREAAPLVAAAARQALEPFLRDHPDEAEAIFRHLRRPRRADPKTGMPL